MKKSTVSNSKGSAALMALFVLGVFIFCIVNLVISVVTPDAPSAPAFISSPSPLETQTPQQPHAGYMYVDVEDFIKMANYSSQHAEMNLQQMSIDEDMNCFGVLGRIKQANLNAIAALKQSSPNDEALVTKLETLNKMIYIQGDPTNTPEHYKTAKIRCYTTSKMAVDRSEVPFLSGLFLQIVKDQSRRQLDDFFKTLDDTKIFKKLFFKE